MQPHHRAMVIAVVNTTHRTDLVSRRHIDLQRVSAALCPAVPDSRSY
jgi:hypothetical protein